MKIVSRKSPTLIINTRIERKYLTTIFSKLDVFLVSC